MLITTANAAAPTMIANEMIRANLRTALGSSKSMGLLGPGIVGILGARTSEAKPRVRPAVGVDGVAPRSFAIFPAMSHSSRVLGFALVLGSALAAQQPAATKPSPETVDVHSYARPEEARIKHVGLDWTVDFTRKEISGAARYLLERAPGSKEIVLDTRDLVIEKVEALVGREARPAPTTFKLGPKDPILGAPLTSPCRPTFRDRIYYRTTPSATGLQWLAPEQTATKTQPYLFSQAQAIHARSFIPIQDSPGLRVTWDALVTVPKGMTAVMSGGALGDSRPAGSLPMLNPVPPYLIAIAVGNLEFAPIGTADGRLVRAGRRRTRRRRVRRPREDGRGRRGEVRRLPLGPLRRARPAAELPLRRHGEPDDDVRDADAPRRRSLARRRDRPRAGALVVRQPRDQRDVARLLAERGLHGVPRGPDHRAPLRRAGRDPAPDPRAERPPRRARGLQGQAGRDDALHRPRRVATPTTA